MIATQEIPSQEISNKSDQEKEIPKQLKAHQFRVQDILEKVL